MFRWFPKFQSSLQVSRRMASSTTRLTLESTLPISPNRINSAGAASPSNLTIPRLGFGVYRSPASVCTQSCLVALNDVGYRHIDTAQFYANEAQVGDALEQSGLKRSDVFVTTKIIGAGGSVEKSYQKCIESVKKISGGDEAGYVDLFLIHSPNAGEKARKEMWLALEKLYQQGKTKAIGVSNFGIGHIEEMKQYASEIWPPQVNQIELHPWCQQREIVDYCNSNGIVVQAYSPLVRNYKANDETLVSVAKKYNTSTQQVLIRYCLQKGWVPLPKSDDPDRIKSNADVYGFDISTEDMQLLDSLDEGRDGSIVQAVTND